MTVKTKRLYLWILFCWLFLLPELAVAAPTPVATVQTASGKLWVRRKGKKVTEDLRVRKALYAGDIVGTGSKSKATILFSNGALLRLNAESAIQITAPVAAGRGKESLFRALQGEVWSRLRPGNAVQTPSSVLGVLGTEIHLVVDEASGTATLTVIEGTVEFWNDFGLVEVGPSQRSVSRPGVAPSKPLTVENPGLILEWSLDLERAIIPHEKFYISLDRRIVNAELQRRASLAQAHPDDAQARSAYGDALFDSGRYDEALREYEAAKRLAAPLAKATLTRIGQALLKLDRLDEAEVSFRAAGGETSGGTRPVQLSPVALESTEAPSHSSASYAPALAGLAWLELLRSRPAAAQAVAERAIAAGQSATTVRTAAGGDVSTDSSLVEARIALGLSLMRQPGKLNEAVQAFQAALAAPPPTYHYQARAWLALVLLAQDDVAGALREAQTATRLAPQSGLAHG
ncbi:MAG: FecR domain-containing protein, partial [Armatimonadota bacterium]|nr:FecR domain-containing protein [Armatimonadota bacterium]